MKKSGGLNAAEKKQYCDDLTAMLVELRKRLGQTQEEMEGVCGISRVTLSQIESGRSRMSWLHFTALMHMFSQNQETKELLFARGILNERLMRIYQRTPSEEAPDFNCTVLEYQFAPQPSVHETGDGDADF